MTRPHSLALTFLLAGIPLSAGLCQVNSNENNALPFTVNGAEYMRISGTAGNVGIGTTDPVAKLTVAGNVSVTSMIDVGHTAQACATAISGSIRYETTSDTLQICTSAGWKSLTSTTVAGASVDGSGAASHIAYWSDVDTLAYDSSQLYWDGTNNRLGVGTASPNVALDVRGQIYASATIGGAPPLVAFSTNGTLNARMGSWSSDNAALALYTSGGTLINLLNTSGDSYLNGGNVGIGTASPDAKMSILGEYNAILNVYRNANVASVGAAGADIQIGAINGTTKTPAASLVAQLDNPATTGKLAFYTRTADALSEKMRITDAGKVGIGTTGPNEKLSVVGNVLLQDSTSKFGFQNDATNYYLGGGMTTTTGIVGHGYYGWTFRGGSGTGLRVDASSNVGIGTDSPIAKLHVVSGRTYLAAASEPYALGVQYNTGTAGIFIGGTSAGHLQFSTWGGTSIATLDSSGNHTATAFLYSSDKRLKTDIRPLGHALDKLAAIQPVSFRFISPTLTSRTHLGVIAQEVETVFPEAVTTKPDGYKAVDYPALVPVLIEAVKELKVDNDSLRAENRALERRLDKFEYGQKH